MITENMIINIGSSFLSFSKIFEGKKQMLNIRVMGEERTNSCFLAEEFREKHLFIGRGITCNLRLNDNLLSKIHVTIFYSAEGWRLIDGDTEKNSTNGTWIYISEDYEIYSSMIFKSSQTVFQVTSISSK